MGGLVKTTSAEAAKDPFGDSGEYDYSALRTISVDTGGDSDLIVNLIKSWSQAYGYEFQISYPTGKTKSPLIQAWRQPVIMVGQGSINGKTFLIYFYFKKDDIENNKLDEAVSSLSSLLSEKGKVQVSTAPKSTVPRRKSISTWKRS